MVQINVKGVPPEVKKSVKHLAAAYGTSETRVILKALEVYIKDHWKEVQEGARILESSPLRKG